MEYIMTKTSQPIFKIQIKILNKPALGMLWSEYFLVPDLKSEEKIFNSLLKYGLSYTKMENVCQINLRKAFDIVGIYWLYSMSNTVSFR